MSGRCGTTTTCGTSRVTPTSESCSAAANLASRSNQQRRAYATAKQLCADVEVVCASRAVSLEDSLTCVEDVDRVIGMLVGETQRITEYAARGFAIPQPVPAGVERAFGRLAA